MVTDAQGPAAALGRDAAVGLGVGGAVWVGAGVPHDDTATTIEVTTTPARTLPLRTIPCPSSSAGWVTVHDDATGCPAPAEPPARHVQISLAGWSRTFDHMPGTTAPQPPSGRCEAVTGPQLATGSNAPTAVAEG